MRIRMARSLVGFLGGVLSVGAIAQQSEAGEGVEDIGVAVIELFSSEGCHSCPPAKRIEAAAEAEDRAVVILGYHVDYWDNYGWKDPYSLAEASARQRRYARHWKSTRVYTPQMIVNGRAPGFVGSDGNKARAAVKQALGSELPVEIEADIRRQGGEIAVTFDLDRPEGDETSLDVVVALTESGLGSDVTGGENRGKSLEHASVVRAFRVVRVGEGSSGRATIALPDGVNATQCRTVVFAQNAETLRTVGVVWEGPEG